MILAKLKFQILYKKSTQIPPQFHRVRSLFRSEMMFIDDLQHIQGPVARSNPNSRRSRLFLVRSARQLISCWFTIDFLLIFLDFT